MESQELVRKLVIGSKAIDQMRQEVDAVVRMVVGLLKNRSLHSWRASAWPNPVRTVFVGADHCWTVSDRNDGKNCLRVDCCLSSPHSHVDSLAYSNFNDGVPTMWEVQRVHEALSTFVEGMQKTFDMTNNLQVLLNAADYAEKNGWRL